MDQVISSSLAPHQFAVAQETLGQAYYNAEACLFEVIPSFRLGWERR